MSTMVTIGVCHKRNKREERERGEKGGKGKVYGMFQKGSCPPREDLLTLPNPPPSRGLCNKSGAGGHPVFPD